MSPMLTVSENPVIHVVVIGFHHKKGCQIEYVYPPFFPGGEMNTNEAPVEWKHLPSLAIPDGAHNYEKDAVFFHLPARDNSNRTVFGVACYRQIDSKDLKIKTQDITRSTVQKSVCVLSYLPLYGLIQAKLELITHAYFRELDFSKVSLLEETYNSLNASLTESLLDGGSQVFLGTDVKDLVHQFRHKILSLFKLILLERRILFTGSPVGKLGNSIMSILSLFPGMIEHGLVECTGYGLHKNISPTMVSRCLTDGEEEFLEIRYSENAKSIVQQQMTTADYISEEPESPTIYRGGPNFPTDISTYVQSLASVKLGTECTDLDIVASNVTSKSSDHLQNSPSMSKYSGIEAHTKFSVSEHLECIDDYYSCDDRVLKALPANWGTPSAHNIGKSHSKGKTVVKSCSTSISDISQENFIFGLSENKTLQTDNSNSKSATVIEEGRCGQDLVMDEHYFTRSGDQTMTNMGRNKGDIDRTIEDLDSPESINQIDAEDCSSWEEDKLSLTIDIEKTSDSLDENAGLHSSLIEKSIPFVENISSPTIAEDKTKQEHSNANSSALKTSAIKNKLSSAFSGMNIKNKLRSKASTKGNSDTVLQENSDTGSLDSSEPSSPNVPMKGVPQLPILHQDDMGFPLAIFTKGCVCFPYLSLQYIDLLHDANIRGFLIGATNMLFRQNKHLTDVVVDVAESKFEIHDKDLQKQLTLTTADLRFADILVKAVAGTNEGDYFDGTEWEGNDEWLRAQFRLYLEGMLTTVQREDAKQIEDFGSSFIQTWKTTHNYRVWSSVKRDRLESAISVHPCHGNLSVTDLKVRFAHTIQTTEGGKKVNAAVVQTGKYVMQTGKAVGGALTQAKSSLSSWFSSLASDWKSGDGSAKSTVNTAREVPN